MSRKVLIIASCLFAFLLYADAADASSDEDFSQNISGFILHHIGDEYKWHIIGSTYIHLPVILINFESWGIDIFSSKRFAHGAYKGYVLAHEQISRPDGASFLDISITKNVFGMLISAVLILFIFISTARAYSRREDMVPRGFQSLMEPVILFVRDSIARPSIGEKKYERYMPFLLTLFFFILINNLMGLLPTFPGGTNLTGNIAVTGSLALITLMVIIFSGNKNYWSHIFWPPGVPFLLKFPIAAIELIGIFTKPFALMIRLFANITAGHIIILSILSLIFVFKNYPAGIGISFFALFMNTVELLIALLQAYIFTMLSALFIGQAVEEAEQH